MKKLILLCITLILFTSGCGSSSDEKLIKDFEDNVNSAKSYSLTGKMELYNGEDTIIYNLESKHLKDEYYKVILVNENNNHEQVILRNDSGIYVITPSLNKSFKFDSVWPNNSSQAYLLNSLLNDINNDTEKTIEEKDDSYIVTTKVNYPNNSSLKYQKIYFDKDMVPTQVEVYDEKDSVVIKVNFKDVNLKAGLSENDFVLEDYIDQTCEDKCMDDENCLNTCNSEIEETSSLDNIMYPLYVPSNTYLSSSEEVVGDYSDRIILTFSGEKNFVVVEESSVKSSNFEIIPINGNPILMNGTVAALSTNSIYFSKDNIDYYLVSNDLSNEEMVSIASSMGNGSAVISIK